MNQRSFQSLALGLLTIATARVVSAEVIVQTYFDDSIGDGYSFAYPGQGSSITPDESNPHSGTSCLKIALKPKAYSGAAIGRYPLVDLTKLSSGTVEFWIRGETGGEPVEVVLADSDDDDKTKTEVGVKACPAIVKVTREWQQVSIPVSKFPKRGQFWDGSKTNAADFDSTTVKEIKFSVSPEDTASVSSYVIYVDDIRITDQ